MAKARITLLTLLALMAFAGNSLLCRAALAHTSVDAGSFTTVRILSGAVVLWFLVAIRKRPQQGDGSWLSALALFAYAAAFSLSYVHVSTAAGALILFGAVQVTMIGYSLWSGERLRVAQLAGLLLAGSGLVGLLLPGLTAPPLFGALAMIGAGVSWGIYSLRGKGAGDPLKVTAGNFLRAVPMAIGLSAVLWHQATLDLRGLGYAALSGAIASGLGYALWYTAIPFLKTATAATAQLAVPLIAALGGVLILQEPLTLRFLLASVAILGGIALVVWSGHRNQRPDNPVNTNVPKGPRS